MLCVCFVAISATVALFKARRVLHFAVYCCRGLCTPVHCIFLSNLTQLWSHTGGGAFFFFLRFLPFSCAACFHFFREKGSVVLSHRRPLRRFFMHSQSFSAFLRLSTPARTYGGTLVERPGRPFFNVTTAPTHTHTHTLR